MNRNAKMLAACSVAAAMVLAGCNAPEGDSGGRIDVSDTTGAEAHSARVLPAALIEGSDQVSRQLAQDLGKTPDIANAPTRVTVILGDLNNKTGIVSSDDFEMMQQRIRNNLLQSQYVTNQLRFVENRARMQGLQQREGIDNTGTSPTYNAATTYTLNGDFYRVHRGDVNIYYLQFQLVSFKTNEIVFSNKYEIAQRR